MRSGFVKYSLSFAVLLWLCVTVAGIFYLAKYENTPAESGTIYPANFPAESEIKADENLPTLIFFSHPKCPCTRASLHELNRLMTDVDGRLKAYVVFTKPVGADENWAQTDLRTIAENIPNVRVLIDEDERETKVFNAQTSGLVLLYDRRGKLRYDGGITASRGHEGDNTGRAAITNIITHDYDETSEMPVFGCPLSDKNCRGENLEYAK
jgi:hypothetical protein